MRIAVFSDSHGAYETMRDGMEFLLHLGPIDKFAFCGDGVEDFLQCREFFRARLPRAEWLFVEGNNDPRDLDAPPVRVFSAGGVKIFMTHGHRQRVKLTKYLLADEAQQWDAKIALFGHTHEVYQEWQSGILMLNPGSVGVPWGKPGAFLVDITPDGQISADYYTL